MHTLPAVVVMKLAMWPQLAIVAAVVAWAAVMLYRRLSPKNGDPCAGCELSEACSRRKNPAKGCKSEVLNKK